MKIINYLKIFSQVNIKQAFMIFIFLLGERVFSKKLTYKLRHYYELIHVFLFIYDNKFTIKKIKNSNLLAVNERDLGSYQFLLRRGTSDFGVYDQCLISKQYLPVVHLSRKHSLQIQNIIDAGANIGCTSLYFKKIFPDSSIVSIEAEKNNFDQLKKNITLNSLSNVHLLNRALWNKDSEPLIINKSYGDKRNWSFNVVPSLGKAGDLIHPITISNIITDFSMASIDILKIDIEGGEKYIFEDEDNFSSWLPICKIIVIEFHDHETEVNTKKYLVKYNFEIFQEGELTIGINKDYMK